MSTYYYSRNISGGGGSTTVTLPYISISSKMHYLCEPVLLYYCCRYLSSLLSRCTNAIPSWYTYTISILYFWGMQELKWCYYWTLEYINLTFVLVYAHTDTVFVYFFSMRGAGSCWQRSTTAQCLPPKASDRKWEGSKRSGPLNEILLNHES